MEFVVRHLWLIAMLPLVAAAVGACLPCSARRIAGELAVASMAAATGLAAIAFAATLGGDSPGGFRVVRNLPWFEAGSLAVSIGWLLDPLSASMLLMITFVGTLIFLFSTGYMADDARAVRFFGFLSLFAAAMLGLVLSNSLLLLFICWELVGLASYLLIGFWFTRPAAAAAARKAFLTTRIGDLGFLIGLLWLYAETGTLLMYDDGGGCLEPAALSGLAGRLTSSGLALGTAIALLLFCGAIGKSGQVPLHVWLPDAMEGPTPVSALIHAATMVAAGVFLMARVYPLAALDATAGSPGTTLVVMTWVGVVTALFGALTAVAQTDIKRILAYSTVSQLGFMMMGLGAGGPAVGMLHLLTHAFFKALLFLGAGSVIHGCHHEQDIRRMGGLRRLQPWTFATYAVGMMALSGVPILFSGYWSKDAILHALAGWPVSRLPFVIGLFAAVVTAFYMTRQMAYVFFGAPRSAAAAAAHESPRVMILPLVVLAGATVALSLVVTPFHPWLEHYLGGGHVQNSETGSGSPWGLLILSALLSATGIGLGWFCYRGIPGGRPDRDPLSLRYPRAFRVLEQRFSVDEFYEATVVRWTRAAGWLAATLDRGLADSIRDLAAFGSAAGAWLARTVDQGVINASFDDGCHAVRESGTVLSRWHDGRVQRWLRVVIMAIVLLLLGLWMLRGPRPV